VGFAFDQALIYATGGVAFGDVTNTVAFLRNTDFVFQHVGRSIDWGVGYTVGAGVEFLLPAFLGNASFATVKAEYLYFDLGDKNVLVNALPGFGINSFTSKFETKGHIGRLGFNYRFGT
jgi:outer membrane immunogenic protein